MKSNAERVCLAVALACAAPAFAQMEAGGPPPSAGPQGSSQQAPGQERYDEVGYAASLEAAGIAAAHRSLPVGSFAEVTSVDSGRNIIVPVVEQATGSARIIALSPDALRLLGVAEAAAVRVRQIGPSPQDQAALRRREPAADRMDAPASLLLALRKKLPPAPRAAAVPAPAPALVDLPPSNAAPGGTAGTSYAAPAAVIRPPVAAPAKPTPAPVARKSGYFVQVAALSNAARAQQLATQFGGFVASSGGLHRVQIGPFSDQASAGRARGNAAGRGYPDARIFHQ